MDTLYIKDSSYHIYVDLKESISQCYNYLENCVDENCIDGFGPQGHKISRGNKQK